MLVLDGSYGEGGGQIVRTALSLAALTGMPLGLDHIPAGRPQHPAAVRSLARLTRADRLGSSSLTLAT